MVAKRVVEAECPGCGRTLTIRSDRPVEIEWHLFTGYRGCCGSAATQCADPADAPDIAVDEEVIISWNVHRFAMDGYRYAAYFHECWNGDGDSHDRTVGAPAPPPLVTSVALTPRDRN